MDIEPRHNAGEFTPMGIAIQSNYMFLNSWRKPENPEETPRNMGRPCENSVQAVAQAQDCNEDHSTAR